MTREARIESIKRLKKKNYELAEALVINSLATRLAANFYFKVYQPSYPYKNFSSQKKAEEWLKQFI